MSDWGRALYGDPCRRCGFDWTIGQDEAIALVSDLPRSYAEALRGASGSERHPDLDWSVVAYVCHVGDNLRIWAERLAGVARGASPLVTGYDENLLAEARRYEGIAIEAALWSLDRASGDWQVAIEETAAVGVVLIHPDRGEQTLTAVVRSNAHDGFLHRWDIERSLPASPGD